MQPQFGGGGHGRVGRQPVKAYADAHQIQMGGGVPQEPAGRSEVTHARAQSNAAHDLFGLAEAGQVLLGRTGGGLIRAREMGPQADHLDVAGIPGLARGDRQRPEIRGDGAAPGHAGIGLDMDACRPRAGAGRATRRGYRGELADGGHRQVEVGVQRCAQRGARGGGALRREHRDEPAQQSRAVGGGLVLGLRERDAGGVEQTAQVKGLGELGDAEPGGAGPQAGQGHRAQAVPVGVGLDHGHPGSVGAAGQYAGIVGQRLQIDDGPRRGGRRGRRGGDGRGGSCGNCGSCGSRTGHAAHPPTVAQARGR